MSSRRTERVKGLKRLRCSPIASIAVISSLSFRFYRDTNERTVFGTNREALNLFNPLTRSSGMSGRCDVHAPFHAFSSPLRDRGIRNRSTAVLFPVITGYGRTICLTILRYPRFRQASEAAGVTL